MAEVAITIRPTELSKVASCTVQYASQLLAGRRKPSLERAQAIEKAFGIPATAWPLPEQPLKFKWSASRRARQQAAA